MSKSQSAGLRYIGPAIKPGEGIPLPQGYPACDHDESDPELRKAKIASGFYALQETPTTDSPVTGGEGLSHRLRD